jgi:hypothetical protein
MCLRFSVWTRIALSTILRRIHVCSRSATAAARNRRCLRRLRHRRRRLDTLGSRRVIGVLGERRDRTADRRRLLLLVLLDVVVEDRADIATRRREDLRIVNAPRDPEALVDDLDAGRDHEIGLDTLAEDVRDAVGTDIDRNALVVDDRRLDDTVVDRDLETDAGRILAVGNTSTIGLAITGSREVRTITVRHALLATLLTEPASAARDCNLDDLVIEIVKEVVELAEIACLSARAGLIVRVATRKATEKLVVDLARLLILANENATGEAHLGKADLKVLVVLLERDCDTSLGVLAGLRRRELRDLKVAGGDDRGHFELWCTFTLLKTPLIRFHRLFSDFRGTQGNAMCGRTETGVGSALSKHGLGPNAIVYDPCSDVDSARALG